jgi:hypothetical protein
MTYLEVSDPQIPDDAGSVRQYQMKPDLGSGTGRGKHGQL